MTITVAGIAKARGFGSLITPGTRSRRVSGHVNHAASGLHHGRPAVVMTIARVGQLVRLGVMDGSPDIQLVDLDQGRG
jgi:hypothetical protein